MSRSAARDPVISGKSVTRCCPLGFNRGRGMSGLPELLSACEYCFYGNVVDHPVHMKCYAVPLGYQFPTFRKNVMPLYSGTGHLVP